METINNFNIKTEPLTEELKTKIHAGFKQHDIKILGESCKSDPVSFTAYHNEEFAGCVVAQLFWGALHIQYLYVEEKWRGRKLGKELMLLALKYAQEHNSPFAIVRTMSHQALAFYQKLGFELEFTRDGYARGLALHYLKKELA